MTSGKVSWNRSLGDRVFGFAATLILIVAMNFLASSFAAPDGKLKVCVSILPQAYLAERIGGQYVQVECLVGPGQSPHTYEPTPLQMAALAEARAFFRIGISFEEPLLRKIAVSGKDLNVVDTREGIKLRYFSSEHSHGHENAQPGGVGGAVDTTNEGLADPHVWLDPLLAKILAENICHELQRLDSLHAAQYAENLAKLEDDLDKLHEKISALLAPFAGREFFVFHPTFGYFGDRYGLSQVAVETEGKEPTARQLVGLIEKARRDNIKAIFVQPQFSRKSAAAIARAVGAKIIEIDPLAYNYLENLEKMARELSEGLK
jgi:zinc transport system substrate-binding protein